MSFTSVYRATSRIGRFLVSCTGLTVFAGLLMAVCLLAWVHRLTALFGLSLPVLTGLAVALGTAFELACRPARRAMATKTDGDADEDGTRQPTDRESSGPIDAADPDRRAGVSLHGSSSPSMPAGAAAAVWLLVPAFWTVAYGWLVEPIMAAVSTVPLESMANPLIQTAIAGIAAAVLVGVPFFCLVRWPIAFQRDRSATLTEEATGRTVDRTLSAYLLGFVLGLGLGVFVLAPALGVEKAGLFSALAAAALSLEAARRVVRSRDADGESAGPSRTTEISRRGDADIAIQTATRAVRSSSGGRQRIEAVGTGLFVACLGAAVAVLSRAVGQLMPVGPYVLWVEWGSLILGTVIGLVVAHRGTSGEGRDGGASYRIAGCLLAAAACAASPLLYACSIDLLLAANSFVSVVWLQLLIRSAVAAAFLAALGIAWGLVCGPASDWKEAKTGSSVSHPPLRVFAFITGYLSMRWVGLGYMGVGGWFAALSISFLVCAAVLWICAPSALHGWTRRCAAAASLALVAAAPWLSRFCNPVLASRLLFSTNVFVARRAGMPGRLLPYLDEGRLLATREGEHNTYSVWKLRSAQLQIREGGVTKSLVAIDERYAPQYSAELMQAVLPMVLHEQPHNVLVLGLQGGVALTTCLDFPTQHVTCAESDRALTALVDETIWRSGLGRKPLGDRRVRLVHVDPVLAVACRDRRYDVIICSPDHAALAHAAPHYTAEFYRHVSARLTSEGIFCQRFQYVDFGARPLQMLVKTAQRAFRSISFVETAPGELVLLGTNSQQGLLRAGMIERWKAPHVRRVLARTGWDWVVPLNLSAFDNDALARLSAADEVPVNTAAGGWFAFCLPQEVMRWGRKWQEVNEQFAQQSGSLLKWADAKQTNEALYRLEEVAGRRNLIARYPDQKWAYRKTLKERMLSEPRSVIQQVKGEGFDRRPHPEEIRRKAYLEALGEAVRDPRPESIARMFDYTEPYDPLVSYFAHEEAARLCSRCDPPQPRRELLHRLHLAYFSTPNDLSVRNIAQALELLAAEPAAEPDPLQRRDHIDALLQLLTARWQARGRKVPISEYIARRDTELSIAAAEKAFDAMQRLAGELDLDADAWQTRQLVLERSLVRPLRTYRAQLLHRLSKSKKTSRGAASSKEQPPSAGQRQAAKRRGGR